MPVLRRRSISKSTRPSAQTFFDPDRCRAVLLRRHRIFSGGLSDHPDGSMNKKASYLLSLVACGIAVAVTLTGCGSRGRDENTLRIGAIVEMTGDMPAVGASSRNAAELAVSEVNAAGGVTVAGKPYKIKLVVEDNAAKPDQSAAAANKLITQDDVLAIVGPNASMGAIPAAEIAEASQTMLITPWSSNP